MTLHQAQRIDICIRILTLFIRMHGITPMLSHRKISASMQFKQHCRCDAIHECIAYCMPFISAKKQRHMHAHYTHTYSSKSRSQSQNRITVTAIKRMNYTVDLFQINHKSNEKRIKLNIKRYIRANVM